MYRFKAFGFPVTVQPEFGVLLGIYLLFGLQAQRPMWAIVSFWLVLFGSILLHELGHAFVARRLDLGVAGIFLHGFGGHVQPLRLGQPGQQLALSLAGPAAGLALGLPILAIAWTVPLQGPIAVVVDQLVWVNVAWSLFNLLPMLPLDGGNAFLALTTLGLGPTRAAGLAASVGVVCGVGVALLGLRGDDIFLLYIGGFCAYRSWVARTQPLWREPGRPTRLR